LRSGVHGSTLWGARNGTYRPISQSPPAKAFFEGERPGTKAVPKAPSAPEEKKPGDVPEEAGKPAVAVIIPAPTKQQELQPQVTTASSSNNAVGPAHERPTAAGAAQVEEVVPETDDVDVEHAVDVEQAAVVDAPLNARLLVLAPPGTGKT